MIDTRDCLRPQPRAGRRHHDCAHLHVLRREAFLGQQRCEVGNLERLDKEHLAGPIASRDELVLRRYLIAIDAKFLERSHLGASEPDRGKRHHSDGGAIGVRDVVAPATRCGPLDELDVRGAPRTERLVLRR